MIYLTYLLSLFICSISIIQAKQKIPFTTKSEAALNVFKQALVLEDQNKLEKALQNYTHAVQLDSTFALAYMKIAMLKSSFAEKEEYMKLAMKHRHRVSKGEQLWIKGRDAFYGSGLRKNELSFFQELVQLYPNDENANYLYGFINHHHGNKNTDTAIVYLNKAIRINPDYLIAQIDITYAYIEVNNKSAAEHVLQKALNKNPNHIELLDTYAELLLESSRFDESIKIYNKALQIDSLNPWSIFGKATNLNLLGKTSSARLLLDRLIFEQLGERDQRHLMLAYVCSYLFEGDIKSAINMYQKFGDLASLNKRLTQSFISKRDIIRFYFEIGNTEKGFEHYSAFIRFIDAEIKNDKLKQDVVNQSFYYKAYEQYHLKNYEESLSFLSEFDLLSKNPIQKSSLLRSKILLTKNDFSEARQVLAKCEQNEPLVMFLNATIEIQAGNSKKAKNIYSKLAKMIEIHDIDLALLRITIISKLKKLTS